MHNSVIYKTKFSISHFLNLYFPVFNEKENGSCLLHVSSCISCSYIFQSRYNKKKKSGPYKEAIKQATSEASETTQTINPTPPIPTSAQHLHAITASPTQVHVVS